MPDPSGVISHTDLFHRGQSWKLACVAATTANITISTALNNGDSLDGVTLATGNRVLVKDQSTGSQNGIYVVGASPARAPDMDQDATTSVPAEEVRGAYVPVIAGTANAGTLWKNTNTTVPVLGTTALTFVQVSATGLSDPMTTRGDIIVRNASNVTARLGVGAAGKFLSSDGTDVAWGQGPLTTTGDLLLGASGGTPTRLAAGSTSGHVLTSNGSAANPSWQASSGGSSTITTKDEGSTLSSTVTTLDFVGAGVVASGSGATTTVTISGGGGGGGTMQYPALKPGTPTYDFAGASLDGAFSAHSSGGSFATTDCMTQGEDWMGSALEIQFSAQMGALYVTHSNTDFDFSVGGMRLKGPINPTCMIGIAALDSAGTGVALVAYNDTTMYLATVTTWNYVSNSDNWAANGLATGTPYQGDYWFRLKRVSGTWTAYASKSGRVWDKTFTTRADSITVDRLAFGLFYNTGSTYSMRVTADYFQVDV